MQSFDYIQKCQNAKNAKKFSACAGPCVRTSVMVLGSIPNGAGTMVLLFLVHFLFPYD